MDNYWAKWKKNTYLYKRTRKRKVREKKVKCQALKNFYVYFPTINLKKL